jgi:hypothetical protein
MKLAKMAQQHNSPFSQRHVHTLLYRVPRARVVAVCTTDSNEIQWAKSNEEYHVNTKFLVFFVAFSPLDLVAVRGAHSYNTSPRDVL